MKGSLFKKNSSKFLTAFKQLDKFFHEQLGSKVRNNHFYEKVYAWYDMGYLSRLQFYDLLQFGKLRNAIVHEYIDGQTIAEPSTATVKRIEQLRMEVCRPRRLHELFEKKVITADIDDCIGDALTLFWNYKISQIPIVKSKKIINVLNTNTISWWTAATKPEEIPNVKIADVLSYSQHQHNYEILPQNATLPEAVRLFRQSYSKVNRGWFMDAILITANGKNETPIKGIIVLEDLVDYLI